MDLSKKIPAHLMILDTPGTLRNSQNHQDRDKNKGALQQDGKGEEILKTKTKTKTKSRGTNNSRTGAAKRTSRMCAAVVYAV